MRVGVLAPVATTLRVAKQPLGKRAGKPDSGELAHEADIVAHCIRKEESRSSAELVDRLSLMPAVCDRSGVHPDAPPDPATFCHSFDRYAMYVWRVLLRRNAKQHPQSGHVALDSTFVDGNKPHNISLAVWAKRQDDQSDNADGYRIVSRAGCALLYRA